MTALSLSPFPAPIPCCPEKLAEPEAFPCREDFYTGTHARYGNTLENMIYNGPYTVKSWESTGLRLIPNGRYTGLTPAQNTGVIITLGRDNTMERFLEGLTDCCRVDSNTLGQLSGGQDQPAHLPQWHRLPAAQSGLPPAGAGGHAAGLVLQLPAGAVCPGR